MTDLVNKIKFKITEETLKMLLDKISNLEVRVCQLEASVTIVNNTITIVKGNQK